MERGLLLNIMVPFILELIGYSRYSRQVSLIPENPEDMWHAYNLISQGDTVRASTIRYLSKFLKFCRNFQYILCFYLLTLEKFRQSQPLGLLRAAVSVLCSPLKLKQYILIHRRVF